MSTKSPLRVATALSVVFIFAPGLAAQADVYRDKNGVPHIVADTEVEAFYALGYEEARDGLFHVHQRHQGHGFEPR